jgi:hypothetical protein
MDTDNRPDSDLRLQTSHLTLAGLRPYPASPNATGNENKAANPEDHRSGRLFLTPLIPPFNLPFHVYNHLLTNHNQLHGAEASRRRQ